jgi:hypothetical protein
MGGSVKVLFSARENVETGAMPKQVDILESERGGVRVVCVRIFPGAQKEEETQGDHLSNSVEVTFRSAVGLEDDVLDDL